MNAYHQKGAARIDNTAAKIVSVCRMPEGSVGIRQGGEKNIGDIILRVYKGLVSLSNPSKVWRLGSGSSIDIRVELMEPGTEVTVIGA